MRPRVSSKESFGLRMIGGVNLNFCSILFCFSAGFGKFSGEITHSP